MLLGISSTAPRTQDANQIRVEQRGLAVDVATGLKMAANQREAMSHTQAAAQFADAVRMEIRQKYLR